MTAILDRSARNQRAVPAFHVRWPHPSIAQNSIGRRSWRSSELISTAELAGILGQPELAHLRLHDLPGLSPPGSGVPYIVVPRPRQFEAGHIPGADFLDLQGEFSDKTTKLRFMMPAVAQLEAAFGRHGVGNDSRVVLYSIGTAMWATRFWWMLQIARLRQRRGARRRPRQMEGGGPRASRAGPTKGYPPATFTAKPRPGFFVDKRRRACRARRSRHRRRQRAQRAIPQGTGAEPLRPARPHSRQLQCLGGNDGRSRDQGLRAAGGGRDRNSLPKAFRATSA